MKTWLVRDARAHFGDVLDGAMAGEPQRISRRGRDVAVVVSVAEWQRLCASSSAAPTRKPPSQLIAEFPLTAEEWEEVRPPREPYRPSVTFDD